MIESGSVRARAPSEATWDCERVTPYTRTSASVAAIYSPCLNPGLPLKARNMLLSCLVARGTFLEPTNVLFMYSATLVESYVSAIKCQLESQSKAELLTKLS